MFIINIYVQFFCFVRVIVSWKCPQGLERLYPCSPSLSPICVYAATYNVLLHCLLSLSLPENMLELTIILNLWL